jgi:hypothetical protein
MNLPFDLITGEKKKGSLNSHGESVVYCLWFLSSIMIVFLFPQLTAFLSHIDWLLLNERRVPVVKILADTLLLELQSNVSLSFNQSHFRCRRHFHFLVIITWCSPSLLTRSIVNKGCTKKSSIVIDSHSISSFLFSERFIRNDGMFTFLAKGKSI